MVHEDTQSDAFRDIPLSEIEAFRAEGRRMAMAGASPQPSYHPYFQDAMYYILGGR